MRLCESESRSYQLLGWRQEESLHKCTWMVNGGWWWQWSASLAAEQMQQEEHPYRPALGHPQHKCNLRLGEPLRCFWS